MSEVPSEALFTTADTGLAAYLLHHRIVYRGSFLDGAQVVFQFENDGRIPELTSSYINDGAKTLLDNFHFLRREIRQARRNGGA